MHQLNALLEVEEFPLLPGLNYRMSGIPKGLITGGKTAGRSSTQSFVQRRYLGGGDTSLACAPASGEPVSGQVYECI